MGSLNRLFKSDDTIARTEGCDRDAAAHQPEAYDPDRANGARSDPLNAIDPGRRAFGEENMSKRYCLGAVAKGQECRAFVRNTIPERSLSPRPNEAQGFRRCSLAS